MPPRERQRRDWLIHFQVTRPRVNPARVFHLECSSS
jgi:hypothetical protein